MDPRAIHCGYWDKCPVDTQRRVSLDAQQLVLPHFATRAAGRIGRIPGRGFYWLPDNAHVGGLQAFRSLGDLELNLLVLLEVLVTRPCDSAEVDEDVSTTAILGDEP